MAQQLRPSPLSAPSLIPETELYRVEQISHIQFRGQKICRPALRQSHQSIHRDPSFNRALRGAPFSRPIGRNVGRRGPERPSQTVHGLSEAGAGLRLFWTNRTQNVKYWEGHVREHWCHGKSPSP